MTTKTRFALAIIENRPERRLGNVADIIRGFALDAAQRRIGAVATGA